MPYYGPGTPWHDRKEKARRGDDLEANLGPPDEEARVATTSTTAPSRNQYVRSGRGGAGNYGEKTDPMDQIDAAADASFRWMRENAGAPNKTHGRGGLGNYAAGALVDEEGEEKAESGNTQRRQKLQLDIEKGVEETLAMPQKAKLPLSSPKDAKAPS